MTEEVGGGKGVEHPKEPPPQQRATSSRSSLLAPLLLIHILLCKRAGVRASSVTFLSVEFCSDCPSAVPT